jgi:hypothetical protein
METVLDEAEADRKRQARAQRERFFTDEELCARWGCKKVTLWRWRRAGKLHSGKINGGPNLTSPDEVRRLEAEAGIGA